MKKYETAINDVGDFGTNLLVAMLSLNVFWTSSIALLGISIGSAMILLSYLGTVIVLARRRKGEDRRWEHSARDALATMFGRLTVAVLVALIASIAALTIQGFTLAGVLHASLMLGSLIFSAKMWLRFKKRSTRNNT
jgi:predicted permease